MITSPGPNEVFEVDATIPVTIAVLDTNGLVSVDFLFQDQIYSLEPPFTTTTFALQVSGALIDRQEIIAVGYYISDGIGEQVVDSLTVIVRSKEQLMGFSAAPESVLLHKNNTHRPVYTATFQTFEGQLTNSPDILADIEDPSKLAYNPEDNSFTALDTGSVHAMVTYAGFVDTLYFEIVYFPTSEETPRVLRSEVLGQTVCAGSNEVLIPVETDTPTDVFRIIPEEADADLFISTFNPPLNDFEPYKTINGVKYMVVSTWGGEPIPPGAYQLKAFVANSQTGAYSDLQAITLTVQDSLKAQIDTHLAVSEGSDAVFTVSGTPGAILKYAFNDGPEQTAVLNGGAVKLTFPSASKDVTLFLLSIENPDQTCSLRLSTQAIAAVTFPCACLTHVTLTLNPNTCITRLTLDQAGLGGCSSSYTIIVADTDPSNGDIIDCPGEWTYGIFAPDGSLVCSGKVIAEDKSGPLLIGVDGRCDLPGKRQRAALPAPPNALDPTALVWRDTFLCTDLNGIFNVDASWKDAAYRYYAGRPLFADGCQSCPCAVTVNATDQATYFQCETVRNDQIWARITRTFTATDCYGNQTQAVQEIYFLRPAIPENQQPDELVLRSDACSADVDSMIAELKKNYYLHDDPYACDAEARYAYFPEAGSGKTKRLECGYSFDVTVAGGDYEVCTGGRKVSVLVHYFDWCTGKPVVIDTILLKWYDAKGPSIALPEKPVVISTGPMDCTAAFGIDLASLKDFFGVEVTDNCEGGVTVDVELWSCVDSLLYGIPVEGKKWRKTAYQTMQMNGRLMALGVPVGAHKLRITAFDQCYNQSAKEVYFEVQDKIAPVVKCDDRLNVTLTNSQGYPAAGTGGFGYAKVLASEIGEGASDNCGLAWIRVRRQYNPACLADFLARGYDSDNDGDIDAQDGIDWNQDGDFGDLMEKFEYSKVDPTILMTPALDYAEFFCCDLGAEGVMVELWAQDRYMEMSNCDGGTVRSGGNLSSCWTAVNLEDKVAPAFARPGDATIKCTDRELLDAISVGRAALSLNSPEYQYIEDRIFAAQDKGRFTILSGNECGNMELEAALIPDLHCDAGRVQIRYTGKKTIKGQPVLYPAGDAYIQVQPVHEYNLLFPEDLYGECEDLRDTANVVDGGELGCDVLAVNVSDKRYNGATLNGAPVAECYKIFRTFTVVNWCQYDEACGEPMQWAVVVPRDADGINVLVRDADGGEEAIYVEAGDTGDKVAQETERVREFRFNNPENARCPHTDELFAWMYTQYIFVHDQEAPVVLDPGTQVFYLNKTACTGDVRFLIEAEDACAPATELQQQPGAAGNLAIERARLRLDTDNDPATPPAEPIELGSHGTILPAHTLHGDDKGANKWVFSGPALPEGYHTLLVAVRDDCGNLSAVREIPFSVVDTSVAAPICHHGLSTTLMKNPDTGTGEMTVWASDFVASPIDDCNGQGPKTGPTGKPLITTYYVVKDNGDGIWDAADGLDTNGMPIIKSTSVTLTCDDAQLTQTAIRLYIEDARGNRAWCETYAVVTDPLGLCKNPAAIASVAGVIATENSKGVPEAEVSLSGGHSRFYETGKDGAYRFGGLKTGYDYSITPGLDRHPLDGVSTLDLIQIQKHILGIRPLGSPYKLLAADVNNSRSVSTLDLVQLRKLILGIETKFAHNTSWRFVDAAFLFPDPANPWKTAFPEVANINNLQADVKADFVAIKIGDVNGSALSNAQPRTSEAFRLNVEDLELKAGNEYRIAFTGEVSQIEGFQFTLGFDRNTVELVDIEYGAAGAEHFGVFAKEGLITASWDEAQGARRKAQGDTLFTLVVKAKTDATSLRDVLSINSRITRAEAYRQGGDYLNIELALTPKRLNAQTPFALYQNIPNPFSGETLIGFWLPQAGEATLTIQDVTGRTLRVVRGRYGAGYNQVLLKSEDLRGRGLLFYSLTSGAFRATRRMVVE
ncbi:MAG: hypothetical protein KIPDCIKN_00637 [Haliscomenobacter sp.]|nr:hypothetical protein [Haliscomenobacter sp.]